MKYFEINTAKYAFENGFAIGFTTNKTTKQYEWYIKCLKCDKKDQLPKYTESAYNIGMWPWPPGVARDESEIIAFFQEHMLIHYKDGYEK